MISVRLEPGMGAIRKNVKTLMKQGMSRDEAYDYAYKYARQQSGRRMDAIHSRSQREQRKR